MEHLSPTTPRYLIARYMPDVMRGETHNIGVILWTPEGLAARFIAVPPARRPSVERRHIPSYVTSQSAYRQWIEYWLTQIRSRSIQPLVGGDPVDSSSLEYLEALKSTSNGNFSITTGGFLTDEIAAEDLTDAVDYLYAKLVRGGENETETGEADSADAQPELAEVCLQLLRKSKLISKDTLYRPYTAQLKDSATGGTSKYRFDFAVADAKGEMPHHLYHRVPLLGREADIQKSIYSAAWMFSTVIRQQIINESQGAALIFASPEQLDASDIAARLAELRSVTRVFNLYSQQDEMLQEFRALASG